MNTLLARFMSLIFTPVQMTIDKPYFLIFTLIFQDFSWTFATMKIKAQINKT